MNRSLQLRHLKIGNTYTAPPTNCIQRFYQNSSLSPPTIPADPSVAEVLETRQPPPRPRESPHTHATCDPVSASAAIDDGVCVATAGRAILHVCVRLPVVPGRHEPPGGQATPPAVESRKRDGERHGNGNDTGRVSSPRLCLTCWRTRNARRGRRWSRKREDAYAVLDGDGAQSGRGTKG